MTKLNKWTICQHSAWVAAQDPTFKGGLEEKAVTTIAEQRAVERVGGLLFDDYLVAADFAVDEQYRDNNSGLVPHARGTFAGNLHGFPIYIPVPIKEDAHG